MIARLKEDNRFFSHTNSTIVFNITWIIFIITDQWFINNWNLRIFRIAIFHYNGLLRNRFIIIICRRRRIITIIILYFIEIALLLLNFELIFFFNILYFNQLSYFIFIYYLSYTSLYSFFPCKSLGNENNITEKQNPNWIE